MAYAFNEDKSRYDLTELVSSVDDKADKTHTHDASDITSGTLPVGMGGTGAATASDALASLGAAGGTCDIYQGSIVITPTEGTSGVVWTPSDFYNTFGFTANELNGKYTVTILFQNGDYGANAVVVTGSSVNATSGTVRAHFASSNSIKTRLNYIVVHSR